MKEYLDFLTSKKQKLVDSGFEVKDLNVNLFPFQNHIVAKSLLKGKYAVFADCGLGKTLMQLEWAFRVMLHTNRPVLILAPLAVTGQTIQEGEKFDIPVIEYMPEMYSNYDLPPSIYITNYEQLDNVPADEFSGIVLDESSILKNFEGATRTLIIEMFAQTPYKLA